MTESHRTSRTGSLLPGLALIAGISLTGCAAELPTTGGEAVAGVTLLDSPAGPGAMAPRLSAGRSGTLLTWIEPAGAAGAGSHQLRFAELSAEGTWSEPRQVATGDAFFANWADVPGAAEAGGGLCFAHWLEKLGEGTYAYGVRLARSRDGGGTWEDAGLLHDDRSPTEHGFVSYVALPDTVQAFWLDGREMAAASAGDMQLRTRRLGGGDGPGPSAVLDARVCECCPTDAALTSAGPIVVYRDRSESEIRDVAVVRAAGAGWTEPAIVHADGWEIHGCPVNGPAVDADGDRVAVAWFTAAEGRSRVAVAFSADAGATFGDPVVVDEDGPLGRVDLVLDGTGRAWVSWLATVGDGAEVRLRPVAAGGEAGEARTIVETGAARSAGVPRMARRGDDLVLTWVENADPSRVRVGIVPAGG
jgi:hypothetical protein